MSNLKIIFALFFIATFPTFLFASESQLNIDGYLIKKSVKEADNFSVSKTITYEAKDKDCVLSWEVSVPSEEMKKYENLTLHPIYPHDKSCSLSFKNQLPIHRAIFKAIFKDWKKKDFTGLRTSSLRLLDPNRDLSIKIALASIDSEECNDYWKNYPNHKSGKHINDIFVDISNSIPVYDELESLFREHNLSIMLTGVEKVFGEKVGNIKTYDKTLYDLLTVQGIKEDQRVLYDAGSFYFKIEKSCNSVEFGGHP